MDAKLFASDTRELNRNQKKKRRQKLARFYHKVQEAAVEAPAEGAPALPHLAEDCQPSKRPKLELEAQLRTADPAGEAALGVCTAEPQQHGAQLSVASVPPTAFDPLPAEQMAAARGVCRVDLTHAALLIGSHLTGAAQTAAAGAFPSSHTAPAGSAALSFAAECTASVDQCWALESSDEDAGTAEDSNGPALPSTPGWGIAATGAAGGAPATVLEARGGGRIYIHGNYHRYYGYRLGQAFCEDPRLALLERQWFAGRRCLDIGCNEGLVTLGIAARFGVRSMVGVDIDEHLIRRACTNLREGRSQAAQRAASAHAAGVAAVERTAARRGVAALAQTWFVHGDFAAGEAASGSVDTITALSVTKWVHLHTGDPGLRAFFAKVHSLLAPGGYFVLEPQPWRSYKAAASKMKRQGVAHPASSYFHRPEELELRPEAFSDVLCDEFGFRLVKRLQPPASTAAGFDRPLYLFRKPA